MKIAIPMADGRLAMHFGHCGSFALIDADHENRKILKTETVEAPEHQPGLLPRWLAQKGVNVVIAGGMGARAQMLFSDHGIGVVIGAPAETPEEIVTAYLAGTLKTGQNVCDH
ncbi:MAG TPA: NifB/NifX family molybdenum-iron cluster-binding protein [Candidatus Brocadiia bacterium]|nr:NifB/NifX family molybdenum-iron cluster-binding protein [Candidatus Brocadiia bacterium]